MKNTFQKGIVETDGGVTPCSSTSVDENAIFIKKSWMEPFGCFMLMMLPSTGFIGTPLSVLFPVRSLYLSDFFCPGLQSRKYMKIRQMSGFFPLPPLCVVLFTVPNPWKNEGKQRKQTRQNLGFILFVMRKGLSMAFTSRRNRPGFHWRQYYKKRKRDLPDPCPKGPSCQLKAVTFLLNLNMSKKPERYFNLFLFRTRMRALG